MQIWIDDQTGDATLPPDRPLTVEIGAGVPGRSAYEVWLDQGNTGTYQDYRDSIRAESTIEAEAARDDIYDLYGGQLVYLGETPRGGISFRAADPATVTTTIVQKSIGPYAFNAEILTITTSP
jgi:hypothetical protein